MTDLFPNLPFRSNAMKVWFLAGAVSRRQLTRDLRWDDINPHLGIDRKVCIFND
jgi:hypothetical protein